MTLKLTKEQADLMVDKAAWRLGGILESAACDWEAEALLGALKKADPLREAIRELSEERSMADLDLLSELAVEASSNGREGAGEALSTIHQVKAGRIVEFQVDHETPEEIIEREQARADEEAADAAVARSIIWALRAAESETKAAEGDPRAAELVRTQEQWDEENRKLAEAS